MSNKTPREMDARQTDASTPADDKRQAEQSPDAVDAGQDDASLTSEIGQLKSALAESEKRALMAVADLENYRKRASKSALDQVKYASLPLMAELLEAVDNLERALESTDSSPANATLKDGVKMVADQILQILQSHHCNRIEAVGQTFDPNLHEAVQMQPSDDYPADIVMKELRTGYVLYDRVVRPAQVFVSTGPADGSDQNPR